MSGIADFSSRLLGTKSEPPERRKAGATAQRQAPPSDAPPESAADKYPLKPGDVIRGKYEVHRMIGTGRLGLAFLVYSRRSRNARVLRAFSGESLPNRASRKVFAEEVFRWINLGDCPFIRAARALDRARGWVFVVMNYVAPDDRARLSLTDHLRQSRGTLDADQALEWAIQFCHGMEFAARHGIKCHGDIKPQHILIAQDRTVQITDFGLAVGALAASLEGGLLAVGKDGAGGAGFSVLKGRNGPWGGTAGYMAPELHGGGAGDARSDIYSFGVVLWQMAAGNAQSPFLAQVPYSDDPKQYLEAVHQGQIAGPTPQAAGPLASAVARCLSSDPRGRYAEFAELRRELEEILHKRTGRTVQIPEMGERTAAFWINKGRGMNSLGRYKEAIACFDKALSIAPRDAAAWSSGGITFASQGRFNEAVLSFDKALEMDPLNATAWNNKGSSLHSLRRYEDAILCFDKALEIDPRYADAWYNKGSSLNVLGQYDNAILCYEKALEIEPRIGGAWNHKGGSPDSWGHNEEAKVAIERVLAAHAGDRRADFDELRKTLEATFRERTGKAAQLVDVADQAEDFWISEGKRLEALGRHEDALRCFDKALQLAPRMAMAWFHKAGAEERLRQPAAARESYRAFLMHASAQYAAQVEHARRRISELH